MKLVSSNLIEVLTARCGFTVTGTSEVHEDVETRRQWDDARDCLLLTVGRQRTMQALQRPKHMSSSAARRLVRSLMGAMKIVDNAPTDSVREVALSIIDALCDKPRVTANELLGDYFRRKEWSLEG